ncbi:hypothetical protein GCM10022284_32580 [Streptomyces hundungensis]
MIGPLASGVRGPTTTRARLVGVRDLGIGPLTPRTGRGPVRRFPRITVGAGLLVGQIVGYRLGYGSPGGSRPFGPAVAHGEVLAFGRRCVALRVPRRARVIPPENGFRTGHLNVLGPSLGSARAVPGGLARSGLRTARN